MRSPCAWPQMSSSPRVTMKLHFCIGPSNCHCCVLFCNQSFPFSVCWSLPRISRYWLPAWSKPFIMLEPYWFSFYQTSVSLLLSASCHHTACNRMILRIVMISSRVMMNARGQGTSILARIEEMSWSWLIFSASFSWFRCGGGGYLWQPAHIIGMTNPALMNITNALAFAACAKKIVARGEAP